MARLYDHAEAKRRSRRGFLRECVDIPPAEAWHRLIADKQFCEALVGGTIRHFHPRGCYCVDFADKMLSVFAENCAGKTALTVAWQFYGHTDANAWRDRWGQLIDKAVGTENT